MHHPTRGGARGGAAEFSWDKVKESKDREFYLGNSVAAPTGRWQDGRDINWYNKDKSASGSSSRAIDERREELRKIKEAETAALYAKLGKPPPPTGGEGEVKVGDRLASGSAGTVKRELTGGNSAPLDATKSRWVTGGNGEDDVSEADKKLARKFAKDEVRRRRAEMGEDDADGEKRRRRREDERHRHSSRRHDESDENRDRDRRHRHHHHGESRRHRDDGCDDKESRPHRHRSDRKNSRSRSKSPESSSRHRPRDRDEERHRSKGSPSRKERERREEGSRHGSSSRRNHEREHDHSRHRSHRD
ncbi:uncharacterized protein UTRI_00135 [Ustilago trichophora]|uniref:Multiple myeloma tumor-associated protein 2-like N-terminal domain-containing protein n=1 Tax=Ustilago trichophora TaxID=86804 RepID=A0A5C3DUH8_9BASI|nr:uncharacterized protein UTRI_00135 [Ustilago trichophora]